ncbi:hypothetical protein BDK51DRAFT_49735 [Blyttiomyces helicus]|uniref:IGFBP N-terminal domain-containing protein n=1 Tax=Blyttiomyces helicus TaxID=388810 RepID=A0A4P9WC88_9FUNG|nr:hypothetical protein BDK51DRAFT_49735 [Blyttiomyces helicus]|eukprot:RKO88500.1 hypothetical protein BDK51DRAFT_49735 [Blyttiomyces helicus]
MPGEKGTCEEAVVPTTTKGVEKTGAIPVVGEGQSCGGGMLDAPVCSTGLTCVYIAESKGFVGKKGTCQKAKTTPKPTPPITPKIVRRLFRAAVPVLWVGEGQPCGGGALDAPVCNTGLTCVYPAEPKGFVGEKGMCQKAKTTPPNAPKTVDEGQPCGGGTLDAPVCSTGLKCVYPAEPKGFVGEKGTCQKSKTTPTPTNTPKTVGEGQPCGGGTLDAPVCSTGLTCVYPLESKGFVGEKGTCAKVKITPTPTPTKTPKTVWILFRAVGPVGEDQPCGGGTLDAPVCSTGLTCAYPAAGVFVGEKGTCQKAKTTTPTPTPTTTPKTVGAGESCGGKSPNAPVCRAPLKCIYPPTPKGITGVPGVCRAVSTAVAMAKETQKSVRIFFARGWEAPKMRVLSADTRYGVDLRPPFSNMQLKRRTARRV